MYNKNPFIVNILKEILPIDIRYMLFNYSKCECCKNNKNDVKITLNHLLPVNICNIICDYNVHCEYCHLLLDDELKFSKHKQERNTSKIELQIRFFQLYNTPPFEQKDVKKVKVKKMNELKDINEDDNIMFNKAMKSYFFHFYRSFNKDYLPAVGHKEKLKDETKYFNESSESFFPYYKYCCREALLIKLILYEYILALIGSDIKYLELEDIHSYLDEIFPRLNTINTTT